MSLPSHRRRLRSSLGMYRPCHLLMTPPLPPPHPLPPPSCLRCRTRRTPPATVKRSSPRSVPSRT